jgi:hypothetical protein
MGRKRGVFAVVAAVSAVALGGALGLGFVTQAGAASSTTSTTTTTTTATPPSTPPSTTTPPTTPPTSPPAGEFCTPGFWKNNPGAVAETGVDMTQFYNVLFDPDVDGTKKGGSANPTLQEVIDNPQFYGGEAANNVAALLSDAHPDVNFTGDRSEDTCPLDADEAND